jgi:hypothetical protein
VLFPLASAGALGASASAQTSEVPEQTAISERPTAGATDATADRFGMIDGGQLQITTGTEEDNATFRIALPAAPSMATRFSLALSRPLDDDDEAMPASLDALANGTRVTLSAGYFDVRIRRPDAARSRMQNRARRLCRQAEPVTPATEHPERNRCGDDVYAMETYDPTNFRFFQGQTPTPAATDYGIEATVGFNDFEWFDRVALVPREERRTDWSVAAHVARYLPGSHTALTGSISYQRAFEAADEVRVCPAGTTDPEAECPNMRTAGPTRNENLRLAAGVRHRVLGADGNLGNLAVAPIVTYDVIDDVFGVDVPIYYTPDEDGGLNGGIRFGYRSDRENKFSVAFFVGTTFDVFGGR